MLSLIPNFRDLGSLGFEFTLTFVSPGLGILLHNLALLDSSKNHCLRTQGGDWTYFSGTRLSSKILEFRPPIPLGLIDTFPGWF